MREIRLFKPISLNIKNKLHNKKNGSLSTVVGDEKLTSREDLIGLLFFMLRVMKTRFLKLMKFLKPKPNRLMSLINLLVASSFAFE